MMLVTVHVNELSLAFRFGKGKLVNIARAYGIYLLCYMTGHPMPFPNGSNYVYQPQPLNLGLDIFAINCE